jgi:hypothetical protein
LTLPTLGDSSRDFLARIFSPASDKAEARDELKQWWRAGEEELKLDKEQIENKIKNSTGSIGEYMVILGVIRSRTFTAVVSFKF